MSGVMIPVTSADGSVVDRTVVDVELVASIVDVTMHPSGYALAKIFDGGVIRRAMLHVWVYDHSSAAGDRPRSPDYEVHHKNGNHLDNRASNLQLLPAHTHRSISARGRQRTAYRVRDNLRGFYRPHVPAPVVEIVRGPMRTPATPPPAWHAGLTVEEIHAEPALAAQLARHRELPSLRQDTRSTVPPVEKLAGPILGDLDGIISRLGPWPGELTVAMCTIEHQGDLAATARCLSVDTSVLTRILARTPVKNALHMWRKHRRWPSPTPPEKKTRHSTQARLLGRR